MRDLQGVVPPEEDSVLCRPTVDLTVAEGGAAYVLTDQFQKVSVGMGMRVEIEKSPSEL